MTHPSLRRKPIHDGIVGLAAGQGDLRFVEYQPGNGTRYCLAFLDVTSLPEDARRAIAEWSGLGRAGGVLVTDLLGGRHLGVEKGCFLHWSFVGERLGCSTADAVVLAELIAHVVGAEAVSSEEFAQEARWQ